MKTVLCYYSYHHGNTRKVAEAMAAAGDVTLLDVRATPAADLNGYDCHRPGFRHLRVRGTQGPRRFCAGQPARRQAGVFCDDLRRGKGRGHKSAGGRRRRKGLPGAGASSAARALIPSGRSSWWAASPKATPTRRTWRMRACFIKAFPLPAGSKSKPFPSTFARNLYVPYAVKKTDCVSSCDGTQSYFFAGSGRLPGLLCAWPGVLVIQAYIGQVPLVVKGIHRIARRIGGAVGIQ